jgi:hypothetical protein
MTKLGEREKGTFPSQPVPNPNEANPGPSQVNAIHMLRSGKEVDNQARMPEIEETRSSTSTPTPVVDEAEDNESKKDFESTMEIPTPFPNRLKPKKNNLHL